MVWRVEPTAVATILARVVFPLPGALLLPRARLPLHLFEPRYLQMLEDTLKTPGRLIGMIQPTDERSIGKTAPIPAFIEITDMPFMPTP